MKKNNKSNTRTTITKVAIPDVKEEVENFEDQMSGIELGYSEEILSEDGEQTEFVKEYPKVKFRNFLAHPDMLKQFNALRPHMALICEFREDDVNDPDNLLEEVQHKDVYVTAVTAVGHNEKSGVVLDGFKILKDGSKLKLVSPAVRFDMGEYPYSEELLEVVESVMEEGRLALMEKKHRIIQMEIFPEDENMNGVDADGYPLGSPSSAPQ